MNQLDLAFLYPEFMSIYADRGNVIAIDRRCHWHGIELKVDPVSIGEELKVNKYDLILIGGGQDKEQFAVARDLLEKGDVLRAMAEDNVVMLVICGGYQLFGRFYQPKDQERLDGVGIFDMETVAGDKRLIGNVVIEADCFNAGAGPLGQSKERPGSGQTCTLVGFENHSGKTFLGPGAKPLGKVIVGFGNNGEDGYEGAVHKNVFGTYLHGSLLPKNPWFTDHLIRLALTRRYGEANLGELDDGLEEIAHRAAVERAKATSKRTGFFARMFER